MAIDVIPSFMSMGNVYDGGAYTNIRLRPGEIQAIYYKDDPANISKRFVEYDCYVQHRAGGTAVSKIYTHCMAIDSFGGYADFLRKTFRPETSAEKKDPKPGKGSKVMLLCLNGEHHNAVIIGGIPDMNSHPDIKEDGHNLHGQFNGLDFQINKDGELIVRYGGATKSDGTMEDGVDSGAVGTTLSFLKNGNVLIADEVKDGDNATTKNSILLDHENGKVQVLADVEVDVTAPKICLGGPDASSPVPLGDKLTDLLGQLIDAINQITVLTSSGASSPPVNQAQFLQIKAKLQSTLSTIVFDK